MIEVFECGWYQWELDVCVVANRKATNVDHVRSLLPDPEDETASRWLFLTKALVLAN